MTPAYQFDSNWGNYRGWAYCPANTVITGLVTKVDTDTHETIWYDDTGLNRVQFKCKYVDHPDIQSCYNFGK